MSQQLYTVVDAATAIVRQRRLVALTTILAFVLVGAVTLLSPKSYLSDAKIYARLGRENSAIDAASGMGERAVFSLPTNREAEMNSIAAMIDSKDLYGAVVDRVGAEAILKKSSPEGNEDGSKSRAANIRIPFLESVMDFLVATGVLSDLDNRERAIIRLQKDIEVEVNKMSHIVNVSCESHDPKLAQKIVGCLVDEYVKLYAKTHRPDRGIEFLEIQTDQAEKDLRLSEQQFEKFKTESGLVELGEQKKLFVGKISRLENELLDTASQLRASQAEIETLESLIAGISQTNAVTQTSGSGNEAIDGMRRDLYQLQVQYEEMAARYTADHPILREIKEKLDQSKEIFSETESSLVERVEGPSRVFEGAKLQLVQRRPILDALRLKYEYQTKQLEELRAELASFNESETTFLRLQRRYELSNDNYVRLERTHLQAKLDYAMQESNLSNLSVFQPASLNPKPSRPNKLLNLSLGLAMGVFAGCALAVLRDFQDERVSSRRPGVPFAASSSPGASTGFVPEQRPQSSRKDRQEAVTAMSNHDSF